MDGTAENTVYKVLCSGDEADVQVVLLIPGSLPAESDCSGSAGESNPVFLSGPAWVRSRPARDLKSLHRPA